MSEIADLYNENYYNNFKKVVEENKQLKVENKKLKKQIQKLEKNNIELTKRIYIKV